MALFGLVEDEYELGHFGLLLNIVCLGLLCTVLIGVVFMMIAAPAGKVWFSLVFLYLLWWPWKFKIYWRAPSEYTVTRNRLVAMVLIIWAAYELFIPDATIKRYFNEQLDYDAANYLDVLLYIYHEHYSPMNIEAFSAVLSTPLAHAKLFSVVAMASFIVCLAIGWNIPAPIGYIFLSFIAAFAASVLFWSMERTLLPQFSVGAMIGCDAFGFLLVVCAALNGPHQAERRVEGTR